MTPAPARAQISHIREGDDAVELVFVFFIFDALERGERGPLFIPVEAPVIGLVAFERHDGACRHIPELDAVAGLFGSVDDER